MPRLVRIVVQIAESYRPRVGECTRRWVLHMPLSLFVHENVAIAFI